MELLPQTADVLRRLSETSDLDLVAIVTEAGDRVAAEVPSCLGFSYCLVDEDLTLTVVATSADSTAMDAAQYLDDGPCLQAGRGAEVVGVEDVLDESRWQLYAATAADRGVRSSLSLPVLDGERLVGTVNFYAAQARAFVGHEERLASIVGASARVAVTNADLSFRSLGDAVDAPTHLDDLVVVDRASGVLARTRGISVDDARALLHGAALRAGMQLSDLARSLIRC
ncbi:GAF and ANTAR domain-containing protein [Cellulomonas sp. P5_C5]